MEEKDYYRRGKKNRLRLSTKRKKCNLLRKSKEWATLTSKINSDSEIGKELPDGNVQGRCTPAGEGIESDKENRKDYNNNMLCNTSPSSTVEPIIEPELVENKSDNLCGRRIVEIKYLFDCIASIKHKPFDCNFTHLKFCKESRLGNISKFHFKCTLCNKDEIITSESTTEKVDINKALVEGIICTGNGYSQLEEICGATNIPCMSNQTFYKIEKDMQDTFESCALDEMLAAGEEEKKLAILNGDVDKEGYPLVKVIADGSWPKRSFKTGYCSLSGCACIIGYRTKKVLFLGIRNKYCCICSRAQKQDLPKPDHKCFKNWSYSATLMEEDVIVEGFQKSLEMHGIKYNMLIGDGDSGIINRLLVTMPYGPNLVVKKVECKNHLLRNFYSKLKQLGKKTNNHKGYVPVPIRKKVESNVLRFRKAVVGAVKYWKNEDITDAEKIKNIKSDIKNSANHVFGKHNDCADYFCKRPAGPNIVQELVESGIWVDIQRHLSTLVKNASSLLLDVTNNSAEQFHSIIAKFIGGKRVNYTSRGSYQTRCLGAVTSWNSKAATHNLLQKKISNHSPGQFTKKYTERRQRILKYSSKRKLDISGSSNPKKSKRCDPDEHYGVLELEEDIPDCLFEKKKEDFLASLQKNEDEIKELELATRGQKDNDLWHTERRKRLTAYKFGKICKMRSNTSCFSTVKELLYTHFKGNTATEYGNHHESDAIREFSTVTNLKVNECGLFIHPDDYYLGASPDGLIGDDSLIEIKCPISASNMPPLEAITKKQIKFCLIREGHMMLKRNHNYYYQVQGQLHVTGRQFCFFTIWTPHGLVYEKIKRDDQFWTEKMQPKLYSFYFECLLPELIDPRVPRNMAVRERVY